MKATFESRFSEKPVSIEGPGGELKTMTQHKVPYTTDSAELHLMAEIERLEIPGHWDFHREKRWSGLDALLIDCECPGGKRKLRARIHSDNRSIAEFLLDLKVAHFWDSFAPAIVPPPRRFVSWERRLVTTFLPTQHPPTEERETYLGSQDRPVSYD